MKKLFNLATLSIVTVLFLSASTSHSQKNSCQCGGKEDNLVRVFYKHQRLLNNLDKPNLPLIVCFSGTPGMGKTTISKKLEERYSAIVISSDEIRALIKEQKQSSKCTDAIDANEKDYFYFLVQNLPRKNGMLVLDMSIDRTYRDLLPWATKNKLPLIIVRLDLPKDKVVDRLKMRANEADSRILGKIDTYFDDYEHFIDNVGIDLQVDSSSMSDLEKLYRKIDEKLKKETHDSDFAEQLKRVLDQEKQA